LGFLFFINTKYNKQSMKKCITAGNKLEIVPRSLNFLNTFKDIKPSNFFMFLMFL